MTRSLLTRLPALSNPNTQRAIQLALLAASLLLALAVPQAAHACELGGGSCGG